MSQYASELDELARKLGVSIKDLTRIPFLLPKKVDDLITQTKTTNALLASLLKALGTPLPVTPPVVTPPGLRGIAPSRGQYAKISILDYLRLIKVVGYDNHISTTLAFTTAAVTKNLQNDLGFPQTPEQLLFSPSVSAQVDFDTTISSGTPTIPANLFMGWPYHAQNVSIKGTAAGTLILIGFW